MACNCRCPYYFLLNPGSVYNPEIRIYHWDFASETREERQPGDPDCLDSHVRLSEFTLGVEGRSEQSTRQGEGSPLEQRFKGKKAVCYDFRYRRVLQNPCF